MRIAIFSDSHDHTENVTKALGIVQAQGITNGIHLGDFTTQPILDLLLASTLSWTLVRGNNDVNLPIPQDDFQEVTFEGRKLFVTHYPQIARVAALSGKYDACLHGHTHIAAQETIGTTLLANPGELCGRRYGKASFGIYDTKGNKIEIIYL